MPSFAEWAASMPPLETSVLAGGGRWEIVPEEFASELLIAMLEGRSEGMNGPLDREERRAAIQELERRGVAIIWSDEPIPPPPRPPAVPRRRYGES